MALIKYCEGCRFEGRSMSSHTCNACLFGSRYEAPVRGADMKVRQIEGEKSCDNCRFRDKNLYDEPCNLCVGESNWEPRIKDGKEAKVIFFDDTMDVASMYPRTMLNPMFDPKLVHEYLTGRFERIRERKETEMRPYITNVIFNDPATIVFWSDHTKTVVKCQDGDIFDAEKGLAMAISKKYFGNRGHYCEEFKKWLPEEQQTDDFGKIAMKMTRTQVFPTEILKEIVEGIGFGGEKE